ncbi:MAG: DUF1801 domain-containing protein [Thermoanaerobaculia bacterium]
MSKATQGPQRQVEAFIQRAAPPVQPLLRQLRKLVRETLPDAREEIKWGRPVYSLRRIVCYLAAAKDHASLGFYRGADLRAPNAPLEGDGKKLRHIKVRQTEDIRPRVFARLLRQAARLDKE